MLILRVSPPHTLSMSQSSFLYGIHDSETGTRSTLAIHRGGSRREVRRGDGTCVPNFLPEPIVLAGVKYLVAVVCKCETDEEQPRAGYVLFVLSTTNDRVMLGSTLSNEPRTPETTGEITVEAYGDGCFRITQGPSTAMCQLAACDDIDDNLLDLHSFGSAVLSAWHEMDGEGDVPFPSGANASG